MPADHLQVPPGRFAGRYDLRGPIEKGGSATVFLAYDRKELCQVALKVATGTEWDRRRWRRELESMERLRELGLPCVLLAKDHGEHGKLAYFVMELCLGGSLLDRVRTSGPISPEQAVLLLGQLAPVLDSVHGAGLVHRDIKPANLLFPDADPSSFGCVLSDWGIARYVGDETVTTHYVIGSQRYMSPQRKAGEPATAADDQYALSQTIEDALRGYVRPGDEEKLPPLPAALAGVLARARHKDAEERYPTLTAMREDFAGAVLSLAETQVQTPSTAGTGATAATREQTRTRVAPLGMPGEGAMSYTEKRRARRALADRLQERRAEQLEEQLRRVRAAHAQTERERDQARGERDEALAHARAERDARKDVERKHAAERKKHQREVSRLERAAAEAQQERALAENQLSRTLEALAASEQTAASTARAMEAAIAGLAGSRVGAETVAEEMRAAQAMGGGPGAPPSASSSSPRARARTGIASGVADFAEHARRRGRRHAPGGGDPSRAGPADAEGRARRVGREQMVGAAQRARRGTQWAAATVASVCLPLTALGTLVALWGTLDHRLPPSLSGHLLLSHGLTVAASTIAICALAGAALCRVLISGLKLEERRVTAGVCLAAGIAALLVGQSAHHHHSSPQWLAPGQWYILGVLLFALSLLAPARRVGRVYREMALGAGLAVVVAVTMPWVTIMRGLLVLAAALAVLGAVGYIIGQLGHGVRSSERDAAEPAH